MIRQLTIGLFLGLISPCLCIYLILAVFVAPGTPLNEIISGFWMNSSLSPAVSLSVITNLGLFFLLDRMNKEVMARGIIGATIVWGFYIIMLLK